MCGPKRQPIPAAVIASSITNTTDGTCLRPPPWFNAPNRRAHTQGMDGSSVTLEQAVALLALPRMLGRHPDDGAPVIANTGRYARAATSAVPYQINIRLAARPSTPFAPPSTPA
eukprot:232303-Chlamydomonas_euryale.AAC.1